MLFSYKSIDMLLIGLVSVGSHMYLFTPASCCYPVTLLMHTIPSDEFLHFRLQLPSSFYLVNVHEKGFMFSNFPLAI